MDTKQFIISKVTNSLITILIVGGLILWANSKIKDYFKAKEIKDAVEISKLEEKVSELQRFIDSNIVQAQHKIVTEKQLKKELETILKDNKELRKYIDSNNEEVKRFIKAEFTFTNQTGGGKGEVTEARSQDGTTEHRYVFDDHYINFIANLKTLEAKYNIKLANIPLELNIIQTELPDGKFKLNDYISVKRIDTGEEIHIKNAVVQEVLQTDKKFMWNGTTMLGIDFDGEVNANLGYAIASYGKTLSPKSIEYRFGLVGISGNSNNLGIYVSPIVWNIGHIVPVINEAQIGFLGKYSIIDRKFLFSVGLLHNF